MNVIVATRRRVTDALAGSIYDNPVVIQAFRTRMRGWKAFVIMGGYVLLMAVVMMIAYLIASAMVARTSGRGYSPMQYIGAMLFGTLTWVQTILLTLIAPALSSGALTYESERKTLELMVLSPLSAGRIVLGK
jgi:ABC-type transport system involved in multi-copper enzyme maturation permease subunit